MPFKISFGYSIRPYRRRRPRELPRQQPLPPAGVDLNHPSSTREMEKEMRWRERRWK